MKLVWAAAVALIALAPRAGRSQSVQEPSLVLSIQLGFNTGSELWRIDRQEALVFGTAETDTVALTRRLRTGLTAVLGATYFRSPHIGFTIEAGFFGIGGESRCQPVGTFKPQSDVNELLCTAVQGRHLPTNAVSLQGGVAWRSGMRAAAPYVRAGLGVAFLGTSFVETSGSIASSTCGNQVPCQRYFVVDQDRRELRLAGSLAAGVTLALGAGYRFRCEVRDFIISLPTPSGPASPSGLIPPMGATIKHVPTVSVGLDVILERRKARRY